MSMEGKVAIVTGSARGIGRTIAEILASRGCDVVIADMRYELAESTANEIAEAHSRRTLPVKVDVSNLDSAREMVDKTLGNYGHVDILVNNAGVTRDTLILRMEEAERAQDETSVETISSAAS